MTTTIPAARSTVTGVLAFSTALTMTSVAALAACAGAPTLVALSGLVGPPSITATESSTDQALELIRKRREEQSGACPAGFTRSGGNCVPTGSAAQVASAQAAQAPAPAPAAAAPAPQPQATVTTTTTTGPAPAGPAAGAGPQPKRPASRPASRPAAAPQVAQAPSAPPAYGYRGSIKDGYSIPMPGVIRAHGVWAEGFYDYERHDNINPSARVVVVQDVNGNTFRSSENPTRRTVTGGVISGVDVSQFEIGSIPKGFMLGLLGGYSHSRSKFGDTTSINTATGLDGLDTQIDRFTGSRQEIDGGSVGAYASLVQGALSADVAVKVDMMSIDRRFDLNSSLFYDCNFGPGGELAAAPDSVTNSTVLQSTTMTNYTVASNLYYRIPVSANHYFEPTAGVRWTHSDFGGNAIALGLRDGDVFRVQGGLRYGMRHVTPDGWIWNTSLAGLLYSDVLISGLSVPGTLGATFNNFPADIDEGKLRVMGLLESRVDVGYGYTLYGIGEVRGGEDVIGFGARGGIRYQW